MRSFYGNFWEFVPATVRIILLTGVKKTGVYMLLDHTGYLLRPLPRNVVDAIFKPHRLAHRQKLGR